MNSARIYAHSANSEAILPDYWRKPMCMSQLDVFSKCRIPQLGVDRLRHTPFSNSKHIIIVRNGHVREVILYY